MILNVANSPCHVRCLDSNLGLRSEIGNLEKLDFLYLADNMLTGTLPTFKKKDTLTVLAVDDNAMHGPIDSVWELKNLQHAYMEQNTFTGQFPSSIVNAHPNLITFDVSNNELVGKLPLDLFLLSRLEILDLHGNVSFLFCSRVASMT